MTLRRFLFNLFIWWPLRTALLVASTVIAGYLLGEFIGEVAAPAVERVLQIIKYGG